MALHHYFKISSKLPDSNGALLNTVPLEVIEGVNKIVEHAGWQEQP